MPGQRVENGVLIHIRYSLGEEEKQKYIKCQLCVFVKYLRGVFEVFGLCIGSMVGLRWVSVAASRRISNASVPCRPRVNCHCFYLKQNKNTGLKFHQFL